MARREPSLTFQGALQILGHHDSPLITRLDRVLGGMILAGAGLGPLAALWGWIDQKNEAVGLLRTAVGGLRDRISGTAGRERRELIAAAHTTIVVAAYFEALHEM